MIELEDECKVKINRVSNIILCFRSHVPSPIAVYKKDFLDTYSMKCSEAPIDFKLFFKSLWHISLFFIVLYVQFS